VELANNDTDGHSAEQILTSLTCSEPMVVIFSQNVKLRILVLASVSTGTVALGVNQTIQILCFVMPRRLKNSNRRFERL
jgi:hypothetical protein